MPPCRPRLLLQSLAIALLLLPATQAHAIGLKPGLWEYDVQSSTNGAPPVDLSQMMQNVSPAIRAEIEAEMKARGMGMDLGKRRVKLCLTPAFVAAGHPPLQLNGQCKAHWTQPAADQWDFSYACTSPTSSGEGHITLSSSTAYSTAFTTVTPQATVSGTSQGHWVSSDCGSVPPLQIKP